VVTAAMGLVLVASAAKTYLDTREYSQDLSLLSGMALVRSVMRDLAQSGEDPAIALPWIVEGLADEGLRFAGLYDRSGKPVATGGDASPAPVELPPSETCFPPPVPGEPGGEGPHLMPMHRFAPRPVGGGRLRLITPPFRGHRGMRGGGSMMRRMPEAGWHRYFLVIEYEPARACNLRGRALRNLLINLLAAGVLALAAAIAWRYSLREERTQTQLAEDRQLKALGQMSAILGHELRNPLASLKGNAQLLLERLEPNDPRHPQAQLIVDEALRLETLTGQVLDFARTGRLDIEPADPAAVARSALERAGVDPVDLQGREGNDPWPLDRPRMEQVLENLLVNAREASPEGAPVELSWSVEDGALVYQVRDHGPGLDEAELQRIFEPFYTRRVRGTGLGLSLARRIVEGHGGSIEANNHPGGGAIFRVTLPRSP